MGKLYVLPQNKIITYVLTVIKNFNTYLQNLNIIFKISQKLFIVEKTQKLLVKWDL